MTAISDSQIILVLVSALTTSFLALRPGNELYNR
uniref:Photosystem I reaction center subunit XII n=6 Tax=Isoetes TaxID=13838 RepID=A0A343UR94_9TRAC|nr:photosystem I subunit XII [Isoetes cangae]YP_009515285.1 photosystem I subunit XII [Isoetes serracarajensis]YP_010588905.1 photosystem I protein M [Isoetes nigritiana]YP_010588975.1 photosystem I protein M [Isoetes welwitschii]YP_010589045.1 photosystem I protein M [Isoetes schweinfurthii]YP_010589115.1 photosystem I protein M [Isoetes cubana]YP_010589185.1 photosystem I protein M [Isoetes pallida]YP_010589255.1 photosystem I protein M [Isoetes australis]QUS64693.1 PsaM [Isoetes anamaria